MHRYSFLSTRWLVASTLTLVAAIAVALFVSAVLVNRATAATPRYVATTGSDAGDCSDSGNPCLTITYAIGQAVSGDTINVAAGTYTPGAQLVIDKDLTISGASAATTTVKPGFDTGNSGDARGWFLVQSGIEFNLSDVTLDGTGNKVHQAIRSKGEGSVTDVVFNEIKYNESGPDYAGLAVVAFGTGPVDVTGSTFTEIGRVGVLFYGAGVSGSVFTGNTYTGKGVGDWLDYALDISNGAIKDVSNNAISGNRGVASSDGSTSAGILVTTYYGPGTAATITNNAITDNTTGIAVGYDATDTSSVTASYNNISGNDTGVSSTAPAVNAENNWWGDATGADHATNPHGTGQGGDPVSDNVDFTPWYATSTTTPTTENVSVIHNPEIAVSDTIQGGIGAALDGDTVNVSAGTYIEQVEIDKGVTLTGVGEGSTIIQGFDAMPLSFLTSSANHPVVYVHDTTGVVIEDLTVDGDGKGNTNSRYQGIGVNNAGATIQDVTVVNVQDTPFSGAQHGNGIYAFNDDGTDRTVTVDNATVYDFQKTGIVINGANAIGQVQYSTVTGIGPTGVTAQNGIQLGYGARGQILDNVVSGMVYTGSAWGATGILGIESGAISIDQNDVTACNGGIRVDNYSGVTTGVTISDNTADGNEFNTVWGADTVTIERNSFDAGGQGLWIIDSTNVTGSDNSFNENDYGLIIDGAVDGVVMSTSEYKNNVGAGIVVEPYGADPINVSIANSDIVGNGAGLDNTSANPVLAEKNWWGHATGADHASNPHGTGQGGDSASDNVDFTPWYATSTTTPGTENVSVTHNPVIAVSDTIQGAIAAALDGDTVAVGGGKYTENVIVNKDVTLAGVNPPDGGSAAVVNGTIDITAAGATVQSLKVVPGSVSGHERAIAVYAGNATVTGNLIDGMTGDGTGSVIGIGIYGDGPAALSNIAVADNVIRNVDNQAGTPYGGAIGIMVQGVLDGVDVTGNTIEDIHSAGWAYGIEVTPTAGAPDSPPQDVLVQENSISVVNDGSVYDVWTDLFAAPYIGIGLSLDETSPGADDGDAGQVTITDNSFATTVPLAVLNKDTDQILDASGNWWGGNNPATVTTRVLGLVDYSPWLDVGTDTSGAPGFQGDFSVLHVDDDSPQSDATGHIQEGINLVSGSTVLVEAGTYDEALNIEGRAGLTVDGQDSASVTLAPTSTLCWNVSYYGCGRVTVVRVVDSTDVALQNMTMDFDAVKGNFVHGVLYWDSTGQISGNVLKNMSVDDLAGGYYEIGSYLRAPSYTDGARAAITVSDNTFIDAGRVATVIHDFVEATISGNTFYKTFDDFGYAIELGSRSIGTINGNTIYGYDTPAASDGSASAGIYIENAFTNGLPHVNKPVTVSANTITGNQYGLWIGNEYDTFAGDVDIDVTLEDNNIHDNVDGGVLVADEDKEYGSSVSVHGGGNTLADNGDYGYYIYTQGDGDITVDLTEESIAGQDTGVYVEDTHAGPDSSSYDVSIRFGSIEGNTTYGVNNTVAAVTVDAEDNWWGACDGPSGEGPGTGDAVTTNVDYDPWEMGLCDKDGDGLTNDEETYVYGTDPLDPDTDGDVCYDGAELLPVEMVMFGGGRDPLYPWDYFNPTNDGQNRVDDILAVVEHYFLAEGDPGYDVKYDRTYVGPEDWNLGPPDGRVRVDDILNMINHYFHDCGEGIVK